VTFVKQALSDTLPIHYLTVQTNNLSKQIHV